MIAFRDESTNVLREAPSLFMKHYHEIGDPSLDLSYNIGFYEKLEAHQRLIIHGIRSGNALIGYAFWLLNYLPLYPNTFVAFSDMLYLEPEQRKGLLGYRFLKWSAARLRDRGVSRARFFVKPHHDFSKLLERLGAHKHETSYELILG